MKSWYRAHATVIKVVVAASVVGLAFVVSQIAKPERATASTTVSIVNFVDSMKKANDNPVVLTYLLNGYSFLAYGTIIDTQIPSAPGAKVATNTDGYSGSGHFAYVFHGPTGRIVQWIKNGTNVSACVNIPITGTYVNGTFGKLQCSRPSPFIPSNGFIEEDVGFVPLYVIQSVTNFDAPKGSTSTISIGTSKLFGRLRCLTQMSGTTTQTTCINGSGYVVSWRLQNGMGSFSRAFLSSLGHHPTAREFNTLIRPTKPLILPAV